MASLLVGVAESDADLTIACERTYFSLMNQDARQRGPDSPRALREAVKALVLAHGTLDDTTRPCGMKLSRPQAWALLELRERGELTVTQLAARLNIDRTNVSRLCARLSKLGQIERVSHPSDGRARLVRLTAQGETLARAVDAASARHFADVLARLDHDPGSLVASLRALTTAMSESTPPTSIESTVKLEESL